MRGGRSRLPRLPPALDGLAGGGTSAVYVIDTATNQVTATIRERMGRRPWGITITPDGSKVYTANGLSDSVSVIDTASDRVVETIGCRPANRLSFGSGCNTLALDPGGSILYVANGSNNCVAVVLLCATSAESQLSLGRAPSTLRGLIPTGWYPGAIQWSKDARQIYVANIKGHGSLDDTKRPKEKGKNSHDHLGSISVINLPGGDQLAAHVYAAIDHGTGGLPSERPRLHSREYFWTLMYSPPPQLLPYVDHGLVLSSPGCHASQGTNETARPSNTTPVLITNIVGVLVISCGLSSPSWPSPVNRRIDGLWSRNRHDRCKLAQVIAPSAYSPQRLG